MPPVSERVRRFFDDFEHSREVASAEGMGRLYANSFMFAGPDGAQPVQKDAFLKVLPRRQEFVKAVGLTSSTLQSLEESRLDEHYVLVKADWLMEFGAASEKPIRERISATYLLYQQGDELQIVLQLDHQDLMKRIQALGLAPSID